MSVKTCIYNLEAAKAKSDLIRSVILHVPFHAWGNYKVLQLIFYSAYLHATSILLYIVDHCCKKVSDISKQIGPLVSTPENLAPYFLVPNLLFPR